LNFPPHTHYNPVHLGASERATMEAFSNSGDTLSWTELNESILSCRKCPRLVAWREQVAATRRRAYRQQTYWGRPVPGFGDASGRVLVVGLAPGAHGANRTGRMFTGDGSGDFLYRALHRAGFASQARSITVNDGLTLENLYISAVCRCAPPGNKPSPAEITNCLPYLKQEISFLRNLEGIVALGRIAFDNVSRLLREDGVVIPRLAFAHGAVFSLGGGLPWLVASYHPSRQNTQTGRLTEAMFDEVWEQVISLLNEAEH
jgi:uracil-DNA glycosylase family 4